MPRTYRSEQRTAQADETRGRVLAAASDRFRRVGYAGTTMRAVAADARVAVQTVESGFGTKARLLQACIDVAIVGDDQPVPVLERAWTREARLATTPAELLRVVTAVLGPAQERSAGLVLAVFEGAATDPALARLADDRIRQRRGSAAWVVDRLRRVGTLRDPEPTAVDTLWTLMDPALYQRLVGHLGWSRTRYERWIATSAERLLVADPPPGEEPR